MSYESWRISFQNAESAAKSAYIELESLKSQYETLKPEIKCKLTQKTQFASDDVLERMELLQECLLLSQFENNNFRAAINRIEFEYDYTLDDDFNAALKDAMTLTYPTLDDLNAYVESEIERRLGEPVAIGMLKNNGDYGIMWKQTIECTTPLYALRKAE